MCNKIDKIGKLHHFHQCGPVLSVEVNIFKEGNDCIENQQKGIKNIGCVIKLDGNTQLAMKQKEG